MKAEYDLSKAKRGAVAKTAGKTRITIYLDDDVLAYFRDAATRQGQGYQTAINRTLRDAMHPAQTSADSERLDTAPLLVEIRNSLNEIRQRLPLPAKASASRAFHTSEGGVLKERTRTISKKGIHVVPHEGGWAVKREGAIRASSVHDRKADALESARDLSRKNRVEVVIHGKDGKIQDRDSYGNGPHPPKDEKH